MKRQAEWNHAAAPKPTSTKAHLHALPQLLCVDGNIGRGPFGICLVAQHLGQRPMNASTTLRVMPSSPRYDNTSSLPSFCTVYCVPQWRQTCR